MGGGEGGDGGCVCGCLIYGKKRARWSWMMVSLNGYMREGWHDRVDLHSHRKAS